LPDDGLSLKPKYVVSNKTSTNSVVVYVLCFFFTAHVSQRDVKDKDISTENVDERDLLFKLRWIDNIKVYL
jgi:hypothetical protein